MSWSSAAAPGRLDRGGFAGIWRRRQVKARAMERTLRLAPMLPAE